MINLLKSITTIKGCKMTLISLMLLFLNFINTNIYSSNSSSINAKLLTPIINKNDSSSKVILISLDQLQEINNEIEKNLNKRYSKFN